MFYERSTRTPCMISALPAQVTQNIKAFNVTRFSFNTIRLYALCGKGTSTYIVYTITATCLYTPLL